MDKAMDEARQTFMDGLSRIAEFWGFPRAMGAIFGTLYLSESDLTLDDITERLNVSKATSSTNIRLLMRLKMVKRHLRPGDRKDYYSAEPDLWAIVRNIIKERQESEFDDALKSVARANEILKGANQKDSGVAFSLKRIEEVNRFFRQIDGIVDTIVALDRLRLATLSKLLSKAG